MKWFMVYFFVSSQIYPQPGLNAELFVRDHARQTCNSYNAAHFDGVVEMRRSGRKHGRVGYAYVARCYNYNFNQPNRR